MNKAAVFNFYGSYHVVMGEKPLIISPHAADIHDFILEHDDIQYYILAQPKNHKLIQLLFFLNKSGVSSFPNKILSPYIFNQKKLWPRRLRVLKSLGNKITECKLPASVGGPRDLLCEDLIYSMVQAMLRSESTPIIAKNPYLHSACVPLNFFTIPNEDFLLLLLGMIGDPRWYSVPESSNYFKVLLRELKFVKRTPLQLLKSDNNKLSVFDAALCFWFSNDLLFEAVNNYNKHGCRCVKDTDIIGLRPGDYFVRLLYNKLNDADLEHAHDILYEISKHVLHVVSEILMWTYNNMAGEFFTPEYWLPKEEAQLFKEYIETSVVIPQSNPGTPISNGTA